VGPATLPPHSFQFGMLTEVPLREQSNTPVPFSHEEVRCIREVLSTSDIHPTCPLCDGKLKITGPEGGGSAMPTVWRVECPPCNRAAIFADLPRDHRAYPDR
jgi:hypothetical protein